MCIVAHSQSPSWEGESLFIGWSKQISHLPHLRHLDSAWEVHYFQGEKRDSLFCMPAGIMGTSNARNLLLFLVILLVVICNVEVWKEKKLGTRGAVCVLCQLHQRREYFQMHSEVGGIVPFVRIRGSLLCSWKRTLGGNLTLSTQSAPTKGRTAWESTAHGKFVSHCFSKAPYSHQGRVFQVKVNFAEVFQNFALIQGLENWAL